jgi:hypothetical protein
VRVEVEMPRDLYDRLTSCDDAPRCRYDMATGRAEFVAEPESARQFRESNRSRVLPGLDRDELDRLLAARTPSEASQRSRRLARQVARAMLASRATG